jgi:hypothetical protein
VADSEVADSEAEVSEAVGVVVLAVGEAEVSEVIVAAVDSTIDLEKCIQLFVMNARRNAKFHSNRQKANQFIARIAIRKRKDINCPINFYFLLIC